MVCTTKRRSRNFTAAVLRFDGSTGQLVPGDFIPSGTAGLSQPRGLLYWTDGYLYVTSVGVGTSPIGPDADSVLRFNALTGAPAGGSAK